MRHFTLLKETEGKAYQPDLAITELLNKIDELPLPPRHKTSSQLQAFFGMSMNNSVNGSANPSIIDGNIPRSSQQLPDQLMQLDDHAEQRASLHRNLQMKLREMTMVLDEKNMVLSTANETLSRQLGRLDTTMPYVEAEISEEARLGSNTHWALPHMKDLRRSVGNGTERSRRDIQAAANLAAAAAAMHDNDVAASRSEARREAMLAKRGHRNHNLDSDFDERPVGRKIQSNKARKPQEERIDPRAPPQPHKRRRVEKPAAAAMERTVSTATNGRAAPASRDAPREALVVEAKKKRAAPTASAPRKRHIHYRFCPAQLLTRSTGPRQIHRLLHPLLQGLHLVLQRFATTAPPIPALAAINEQRGRPGSSQSQSKVVTEAVEVKNTPAGASNPRTTASRPNGGESNVDQNGDVGMANTVKEASKASEALKREETEPVDEAKEEAEAPPSGAAAATQRSRGGSRASKPGTPHAGHQQQD
ncbi:hypothetical protein FH972_021524 [Carpinus fangiana]|uniref:Uncharacterized protein n=1 Tax=Carpinus fangiana TaxID=176857 RepID=A0A5N6KPJ6_9ROSI|nr:hypothetical protein FH972_021524 [Carpinus fangiana]